MRVTYANFELLLLGTLLFGNACSFQPPLPKISSQEAAKYETQYQSELNAFINNYNQNKVDKWIQSSNKKEPCKVFVRTSKIKDKTIDPEYKIFWDGECKNGFAYGLGREFERGILLDAESIGIYTGTESVPEYFVQKDNLNNSLIEGNLNLGYVVQTKIEETNMILKLSYEYGYLDQQDHTALINIMSPLEDNSIFVKAYPNYSYKIVDHTNNDFDNKKVTVNLLDKDKKANGFGFIISKQGYRVSAEFSHGKLDRKVELPQEYFNKVSLIFTEIKDAGRKAIDAQKKALLVKKQYKKRICKDSITVDFIDNAEYKGICNENKYFAEIKDRIDKEILRTDQAKAQKREQQNQRQLIQARQMEASAAQRQASAAETANFIQSMQNFNQNSQLQQLNDNLFMMRMGL